MNLPKKILLFPACLLFVALIGCASPQQPSEQFPITPMLGHPYNSTHGLEPRWGDPLSVQFF